MNQRQLGLPLLAGIVGTDESSASLQFFVTPSHFSRWSENTTSRAGSRGCSHDDSYYSVDTQGNRIICSMSLILISSVSNESENKRTLMLEMGCLDFRSSSSSVTF